MTRCSTPSFGDLEIHAPEYHLGMRSASQAVETARVMEAFEPVLLAERRDWVPIIGDVNCTLACALVASKLGHELDCGIEHAEAGLRSHDWRTPEEVNRVGRDDVAATDTDFTDRPSDILFTPSRDAHENPTAENIPGERVRLVGKSDHSHAPSPPTGSARPRCDPTAGAETERIRRSHPTPTANVTSASIQ